MLNYGFSPRIPYSVERRTKSPAAYEFVQSMQRRLMEARTLHRVASQCQKQYADTRRADERFQQNDWVLLSSKNLHFKKGNPKLLPRYVGPFKVHKEVSKDAHELVLPANWKIHDIFHVSQLDRYHRDGSCQPPPPAEMLEGELEYEVDSVLDHQIDKDKGEPQF